MAITSATNVNNSGKMTERARKLEITTTTNAIIDFTAGTGAPSHTAGKGSLYSNITGSSSSTRLYVNSDGAATWVAVTTAS